jgi:hypothetical protein
MILIEINGSMIVTFWKDQQILKELTLLVHKPLEFDSTKTHSITPLTASHPIGSLFESFSDS